MTDVIKNIESIRPLIPDGVRLVAVSKTKPAAMIQDAYSVGQRLFGENKALEMRDKHAQLPDDIEWHFIGHLQTNKIKYIIPYVTLIHSIDSLPLLQAVNKEAAKHDRQVDCLLQFHIATEETKFGLDRAEADELMQHYGELPNVRLVGVMGMATNTDNKEQVRSEFRNLHTIFSDLKAKYFADRPEFRELSMGMSHDWQIAVEEGSTLIRLGSTLFGARDYGVKVND
ncbi:MAG: YggS family pyridoxal phosphate-dependent enzyme [Bacteroidales bacterium]|nr:YggS family pyridoxal phosphate-dependent enzyme [Bacteroidales bacterium]